MLVGHLHIFGKMSSPLPIFKLVCLSVVELEVFFIYFRYWTLIRYMIYKYFLPFCGLFQFLIMSFDVQKLILFIFSSLSILIFFAV